ncbi:MAG: amidohydrolase, partial [bacterium]|nr:amidohydrolase [bacterium]
MRAAPIVLVLVAAACHAPAEQHAAAPTAASTPATAPAPPATFSLYKFGQRIGFERTAFGRAAGGDTDVKTTFTFNDRGSDVPLAALWRLSPDGTPRDYRAWGFVARGVSVDDRVAVDGGGGAEIEREEQPLRRLRAPSPFAAASGYAPVIGQELLVRAWVAHGRPARLALLPDGEVEIRSRGHESFTLDGKPLPLEHLAISGLVWGREDVWIDDKVKLQALVTRDAEFDHFEAMRSGNAPLIDEFVRRAGQDAVAWLAEAARSDAAPAGPMALVGARLVDGSGAPAIEDAVVIVDGDRIVAVGPRASTPIPAGVRRVELAGATVLPGLWDMHAHVEQVEQAAAYLAAGVT